MNTAEMYQEFQVTMDTVDSQDLPEIDVPRFLIFVNQVVDEIVQEGREQFEAHKKVSEDISSLVQTFTIFPEVLPDKRVKFSYLKATKEVDAKNPTYTPVYYYMTGYVNGVWNNDKGGVVKLSYIQHDDISTILDDPFNKPKYADTIPYVLEDQAIITTPPNLLTIKNLVGTFIVKPTKITQTASCNLPEQLHHTIVKRTVKKALENVESPRQQTIEE